MIAPAVLDKPRNQHGQIVVKKSTHRRICVAKSSGLEMTRLMNRTVSASASGTSRCTLLGVPITLCINLRWSRVFSPYGERTSISVQPTSSPAIGKTGRSEYIELFLSIKSMAAFTELMMIKGFPSMVTEETPPSKILRGQVRSVTGIAKHVPYFFPHSANVIHSIEVGMSNKLPMRGSPVGPGGRA